MFALNASSQELPQVIPLNPEVSSILKYQETPVNHSTGVPMINIPLIENINDEVNLSVSLSYHAGGFRVSEIASTTGLGWTLNAGGSINRIVRGLPDDSNVGIINNDIISIDDVISIWGSLDNPTHSSVGDTSSNPLLAHFALLDPLSHDLESDVFSFNFMGNSGKFLFKQTGDILSSDNTTPLEVELLTLPKSDILIKYQTNSTGEIIQWILLTPDGYKYYFGTSKDGLRDGFDKSTFSGSSQGIDGSMSLPDPNSYLTNFTTSWKLMDIQTTSGELISFSYDEKSFIQFYNLTGQQKEIPRTSSAISGIQTMFSFNRDNLSKISSIKSNIGEIVFHYEFNRKDLKGDKALTKIDKLDNHGNLVDSYDLNYDYFESNDDVNYTMEDPEQLKFRLKLNEIVKNPQSEDRQIHRFEYNSQNLPHRMSHSQDFWGFYNGKLNSTLLPKVKIPGNSNTLFEIGEADRSVNETYARANLLKSINFPNGSQKEFEFESNRVYSSNFFAVTENDVESELVGGINTFNTTLPVFREQFFEEFEVINDGFGLYWYANISNECSNPNSFDCPKAWLYVVEDDGSKTLVDASNSESQYQKNLNFSSETVTFRIEVYNNSESFGGPRNDLNAGVMLTRLNSETKIGIKTGGLRVKSINTKDSNLNIELTKVYDYNFFNDSTRSSGTFPNPPTFYSNGYKFWEGEAEYRTNGLLSSNSIFSLTDGKNYSTSYSNVTERFIGIENGKTEYTMNTIFQGNISNIMGSQIDITPSIDKSHRSGVLLNKIHFKYNEVSDDFTKLSEHIYNYTNFSDDVNLNNFQVKMHPGFITFSPYIQQVERYLKDSEKIIEYFENDTTYLETNYFYENGYYGKTLPKKVIKKDNLGQIILRETYYPDDVSSPVSLPGENINVINFNALSKMKTSGESPRIGQPIQINKFDKNNLLIETIRNNFNVSSLHLHNVQTSKGTNPLEKRINYHNYDNYGNLLEVSKTDGRRISYIYGYNSTQPVAKLTGVSYADIPQNLIDDIHSDSDSDEDTCYGLNPTTCSESKLRHSLNALRDYYLDNPSVQVTTYTYDPLIGVTSITDPRGETSYYEYDDFNRLKAVKDAEGNLLEETEYNYRD